jgi:hypothetical protein
MWTTWKTHRRKGKPGPRVINGEWTADPVSAGSIVLRFWSGRDGCPYTSTWLKIVDRSDGSVTYYRKR